MNETLTHALQYADRGWRVIPIKPKEKRPPISAWQTAATTNPETIKEWWTGQHRNCGVGIVTGEESGIFVIDIDNKNDVDGYDTLKELESKHGALPNGPYALTGSGGMHIFMQYPQGITIRNDAGHKLGKGIDIRGEGGQVVAAPTVHPNGNTYQWCNNSYDLQVPEAPNWLLQLLTEPTATPAAPPQTELAADTTDDDYSAAANYNRRTNWHDLLTADGWTYTGQDNQGEHYWVRPNKDPRDGTSATVGHKGNDALTVFTTSIEWLPAGTYSRFGYYACRFHNGDRSAAAKAIRQIDYAPVQAFLEDLPTLAPQQNAEPAEDLQPLKTELAHLIDWHKFWSEDHTDEDWLAYPLIPRGRAISLYAPAKAGKSSIVLSVAAAVATGSKVLGTRKADPASVLYLDYEMTQADLYERLTELGYSQEDDLSNLHYALLPSLPPLDTVEGARAVVDLVHHTKAELVIVDTFGRAVAGDEDSADTVRAFYRHTGLTLKSLGVTYLRTDHSGKDSTRGVRGSSAKNDDIDVQWRLTRTDTNKGSGVTLDRTHSRVAWIPETIKVARKETDTGHTYTIEGGLRTYADGTAQRMEQLKAAGITADHSHRDAWEIAKAAQLDMKQAQCRHALAMMKEQAMLHDPLDSLWITQGEPVEKRVTRDNTHTRVTRDQKTPTRHPEPHTPNNPLTKNLTRENPTQVNSVCDTAQPPLKGVVQGTPDPTQTEDTLDIFGT